MFQGAGRVLDAPGLPLASWSASRLRPLLDPWAFRDLTSRAWGPCVPTRPGQPRHSGLRQEHM